ncbi:MAG: hypothetical protein ACRD0N_12950 [Acidimicrobiales bacterium]
MKLFLVEMRRAMHRRLSWMLIGLALVGIAVIGVAAFASSAALDVAAVEARHETHPAVLRHWWIAGTGDGMLTVAAAFLLMGGLIGGASVVGAEWRAGTLTTMLTWEPRRLRLHLSRVGACAACAALVSFCLQAVYLSAFLPAVLAHGTTAGTDGGWFVGLAAAMARISLLTAMATAVGASIAFVGRNTTAALAAAFAWMAIGENLVRAHVPDLQPFLLGENTSLIVVWGPLEEVAFTRSPMLAVATLLTYGIGIAALSAVRFHHSDVAAT